MNPKNHSYIKKGFTLIELLVVIAIVGLLSVIAVASFQNSQAKARDAQRKHDIEQIRSALEIYLDKYGTYPSEDWCDSSLGSCSASCPCSGSDWDYSANRIAGSFRNAEFFQNTPKDPTNSTTYYYSYEPCCNQCCAGDPCIRSCTGNCCEYSLTARLEGGGNFTVTGSEN